MEFAMKEHDSLWRNDQKPGTLRKIIIGRKLEKNMARRLWKSTKIGRNHYEEMTIMNAKN